MRAGSENFSGLRVFQQTGMMGARWKLFAERHTKKAL
jgi:hypothetical protein